MLHLRGRRISEVGHILMCGERQERQRKAWCPRPGGPLKPPANILIAFVLDGILAALYLWRRDLVANTLAHFLVDFVANLAPRLGK